MKTLKLIVLVFAVSLFGISCAPDPTSSDHQRIAQEKMVSEGISQVGLPSIKNFRELKEAKDIYEMRDQTGLVTYSYLFSEMQGKMIFLCDSIGYPLPYAVQFTGGESEQTFNIPSSNGSERYYGHEKLPQAEPNGLFSPGSAEGSWVLCKDPNGKDVRPVYVEPRVIVMQFKLPV